MSAAAAPEPAVPPFSAPAVVAVEAEPDALLLGWDEVPGAVAYELQMAEAAAATAEEGGETADSWTTLSSTLKSNIVRKKNLAPDHAYRFRVRARDRIDWNHYSAPATVTTPPGSAQRMAAPRLEARGDGFVAVAWEPVEGAEKYTIEMRGEKSVRWGTIGAVAGTSVKKKNLKGGPGVGGYHFRVRPQGADIVDAEWAWSPGSESLAPLTLAPHIRTILGPQLLGKEGQMAPVESLAGKVVAVYASAHWCGPCRQFTPMLAQFYTRLKAMGRPFEIVFASVDQEEAAFSDYYASMPWLALPYDGNEREEFMATYEVKSIPRLVVFGTDGRVLEDNAVGPRFLNDAAFDAWSRGQSASTAPQQQQQQHGGGGGCCGGGGCGK